MVRAEAHSDDMIAAAKFDATAWFDQASDDQVVDLADAGWGGDYQADEVASFFENSPGFDRLTDMYGHLFRANRDREARVGFECHVHSGDAFAWLEGNRPALAARLRELGFEPDNSDPHWDSDSSWPADYDVARTSPSPA